MEIISVGNWIYFGSIEWRPIIVAGIKTNYEVNNYGMIRNSMTQKVLSPFIDNDGYYRNAISVRGISYKQAVHRFVAQAFIPNPENKPQVNHIDGDKSHNEYSNLEWVTCSENVIHAWKIGLNKSRLGSDSPLSHYTDKQIHSVCKLLEKFLSNKEISKITGVDRKYITDIKKGRRWTHISKLYRIKQEKYPLELREKIINLLFKGYKPKEIMKELNMQNSQACLSLIERIKRSNRISLNDYPGSRSTPVSK